MLGVKELYIKSYTFLLASLSFTDIHQQALCYPHTGPAWQTENSMEGFFSPGLVSSALWSVSDSLEARPWLSENPSGSQSYSSPQSRVLATLSSSIFKRQSRNPPNRNLICLIFILSFLKGVKS